MNDKFNLDDYQFINSSELKKQDQLKSSLMEF